MNIEACNGLGKRIKAIFVDKPHNVYAPYPGHEQVWESADA